MTQENLSEAALDTIASIHEPFDEEDEQPEAEVQDEPRDYVPIPLPEIEPLFDTDRPTVRVRVDREGYADVNGARQFVGRNLAGATVNVPIPEEPLR